MKDIRNRSIWKQEETKTESREMYDLDISALNLSVRSYNCLKRAGCNTVGEILALIAEDENNLRKIRNLGNRSEQEILECLEQFRKESSSLPNTSGNTSRKVLIKPAKKIWERSIEEFDLSDHAMGELKRSGVYQIRDLYLMDLYQEPGWYAVRELFEKIPRIPSLS